MPGLGIPPHSGALALQLLKLFCMASIKNRLYCFLDTRTSGLKPSKCVSCFNPGINSGVSVFVTIKFPVFDNVIKRSRVLFRSIILPMVFAKKDISNLDTTTNSHQICKNLTIRNLTNPGIYAGVGHLPSLWGFSPATLNTL